ncbi:GMC family oxidoreductase [Salinarimonas sp. NSM]|uniref:GMC family oxidoreductase n=1 Tax=Salinarimonas sp. NSM TaxID=3458003 RepID=UPI0040357DA2
MQDLGTYDYVVVGAGSAGCVVANRLSRDPSVRVLLLEAGGKDDWIWFHIPVGYLFAIGNPRADWMLRTEPVPGLNGRSLAYPRGKVIGGSSAINAMIYMRGQAQDYDGWRQLGLEGWGWEDVRPVFRQHQDHARPDEHHGAGGEWRVDYPRVRWALLDAVIDACVAAGIPATDDFNRGDNSGVGYFQVNQKGGRRWSSARGFLKPALSRPNLRLETGVSVERVVIEDGRAAGVVLSRGGETFTAQASGEVVLCAGAVKSPQILELSGVGDGARLQALGIETRRHLPGVGENLQDHLQLRPIFKVEGVRTLNEDYGKLWRRAWMGLEYALSRRGPLTMAPSQLGAFARSSPDYETPNLQFHFQPLSLDKFGDAPHPFAAFTASVCNLRPTSRGSVHAASPDPHAPPAIQPNYLDTEEDRRVAADSIRLARRIVAQPPLARFRPQEFKPGPDLDGDEALARAAGEIGTTIFHPVGTAKMGLASDPTAVLDARLRVHGIAGLRVVDASAMPRITSGNTNSPTIMIAEKASAMILEARGG